MSDSQTVLTDKAKYEKCVICHKTLDITCDTPIQERGNYISGCGQLCEDCYYETVISQESYELSPGQLNYILKKIDECG